MKTKQSLKTKKLIQICNRINSKADDPIKAAEKDRERVDQKLRKKYGKGIRS